VARSALRNENTQRTPSSALISSIARTSSPVSSSVSAKARSIMNSGMCERCRRASAWRCA
jgi:hypothetical protein